MILSSCFRLDHTKSCLGFSILVFAPNIKLLWLFNPLSLLFANPNPKSKSRLFEPGKGGGGEGGVGTFIKNDGDALCLLGLQITDFGLTQGVQVETPIFLAVIVSFRVASEEIEKKKPSFYFGGSRLERKSR